jgi:hypothetical protein
MTVAPLTLEVRQIKSGITVIGYRAAHLASFAQLELRARGAPLSTLDWHRILAPVSFFG